MKQILQLIMVILALASGMNLYAEEEPNISTGTLLIGGTSYRLENNQGGTAWEWTANTSTLILKSDYKAGTIQFQCLPKDSIKLMFKENITIESATEVPIRCNGALTILGDHTKTLTLIHTGKDPDCYALFSQRLLSIHEGTLDLQAAGSSIMMNGSFNAKAAALYAAEGLKVIGNAQLTVTVTGNDAVGILLTGNQLTSTIELEDATITANSTGAGAAIWIDNGHTMKLISGSLKLSNDKGSNLIQGNGGYDMLGGHIQYNNGPTPTLTGITPKKGKLGDIASLTGTNLTDTIKVWVGRHETQLKRQDGDGNDNGNWTLSFLIPAGTQTDTATVIVESDGGRAALAKAFFYSAISYRVNLFVPTEASINDGIKYIDVEENGMITGLPSATQAQCVFRGWSKEETTFVPWDMEKDKVESNTQLYGQFVPIPTLAPTANNQDVPVDAPITVTFTNTMTVKNLNDITIAPDPEGVNVSLVENVLTINHAPFRENMTYTVTIPEGTFEEYPADITWSFSTFNANNTTNYHTINLIVGEDIDCNYSTGSLTISEDDHLFLTFYTNHPTLTATDILLLIDGVETTFTTSVDGRGGNYILNPVEKDHFIEIRLREGAIDPDPDPDPNPTGNTNLTEGKIHIAMDNGQLTIDNEMSTAVDVCVYDITGKNVVSLRALRGSKTFALPAGIYIVRAGRQTWKVMING